MEKIFFSSFKPGCFGAVKHYNLVIHSRRLVARKNGSTYNGKQKYQCLSCPRQSIRIRSGLPTISQKTPQLDLYRLQKIKSSSDVR